MFDYDGMRSCVAKGLREYLGVPVVRSNQNEEPPAYPYVMYTIITPMGENKGTYGEYSDGIDRKMFKQTWSITALSKDNTESVNLAVKAREWLDHVGTLYLNDNRITVISVGSVTNRDNILTVEYEYKNGFDALFYIVDEIKNPAEQAGFIEEVAITEEQYVKEKDYDEVMAEQAERLAKRLDGES